MTHNIFPHLSESDQIRLSATTRNDVRFSGTEMSIRAECEDTRHSPFGRVVYKGPSVTETEVGTRKRRRRLRSKLNDHIHFTVVKSAYKVWCRDYSGEGGSWIMIEPDKPPQRGQIDGHGSRRAPWTKWLMELFDRPVVIYCTDRACPCHGVKQDHMRFIFRMNEEEKEKIATDWHACPTCNNKYDPSHTETMQVIYRYVTRATRATADIPKSQDHVVEHGDSLMSKFIYCKIWGVVIPELARATAGETVVVDTEDLRDLIDSLLVFPSQDIPAHSPTSIHAKLKAECEEVLQQGPSVSTRAKLREDCDEKTRTSCWWCGDNCCCACCVELTGG